MAAPKTSLNPKARPRTKTEEKTLRGRPVWIDHTGEVTGEKGAKYSEVTTTIPWGTEWITAPSVDENGKRLSDDEVKQRLLETRGKDFITGEELPTFSNPEKASEYAQWRSDTMFDQEAIEQGFPEEFPMGPEPERKDFIDRSLDKGKDFLEYLTTPSKHGVFNKGGAVMNEQMEMAFMQQGGLKDDGMDQDPVSGNEVPSGSMAKEVRDDISAQISEGEYVVPADVVRYLGVKHFEDLRDKAKQGLQSMEANGRIGGEPVPVGGPQAAPMMQPPMPQAPTPYSPQPAPMAPPQMAMGGDLSPEEMNEINSIMMAQGGMVPADPYQQQQMQYTQPMAMGANEGTDVITGGFYNPGGGLTTEQTITTPGPLGGGKYTGEFSTETPQVGITDTEVPVENEASCEARGMVYNPDTKMCETPAPVPERVGGDGSSSTPPTAPGTPGAPGTSFTGFKNWGAEVDWTDPESVEKFINQQYNMPDPTLRKGAGVAGLLGSGPLAAVGTIGSLFMAGQVLDTVADLRTSVMIAKAYGNTEGAAIAQAKLDTALKGAPSYVTSMLGDTLAGGTMQFAGHVSGASGLDDLPSNIDKWTKNDFTRFQSATGKKAPVKAEPTGDKKTPLPPSTQPTMDTAPRRESNDPGPSGAEVAKAAADRAAAASKVAKSEGVSAPTSGGARSVSDTESDTKGTGNRETYASKVERGGGFNKGGLASRPKKKK